MFSPLVLPWTRQTTRFLADFRIFTIRSDVKTSPRTGHQHDFFVIDCPNWVNVVAVTTDRQLVMVEQFRHGTDTVDLEIPGGVIDRTDASPLEAGVRELREETGYEGSGARLIGDIRPNPAIMSNLCFTLLVEDCERKHATQLDHGEDIACRLVDLEEIPRLVAQGVIRHSLVVTALYFYELQRQR